MEEMREKLLVYFSVWSLLAVHLTEHLTSSDAKLNSEQHRKERASIHTANQTSKTCKHTTQGKIYHHFSTFFNIDILMTLRFSHNATLLAGLQCTLYRETIHTDSMIIPLMNSYFALSWSVMASASSCFRTTSLIFGRNPKTVA